MLTKPCTLCTGHGTDGICPACKDGTMPMTDDEHLAIAAETICPKCLGAKKLCGHDDCGPGEVHRCPECTVKDNILTTGIGTGLMVPLLAGGCYRLFDDAPHRHPIKSTDWKGITDAMDAAGFAWSGVWHGNGAKGAGWIFWHKDRMFDPLSGDTQSFHRFSLDNAEPTPAIAATMAICAYADERKAARERAK